MRVRLSPVVVSRLEQLLSESIAHDLGVKPEEVTPEFIRHWRREHLYPKAKIDLTTLYGGYNDGGRQVRTDDELKTCREEAERFINQF